MYLEYKFKSPLNKNLLYWLDLKVVLDFVPNHCSNESDYFKLSVNRTAGYEDFLVWDDGLIDPETNTRKPPSNWVICFYLFFK